MQLALELLAIIPLLRRVLERIPREDLVLEAGRGAALAHGHGAGGEERGVAVGGLGDVVVVARLAEVVEFGGGGGGVRHVGWCCGEVVIVLLPLRVLELGW